MCASVTRMISSVSACLSFHALDDPVRVFASAHHHSPADDFASINIQRAAPEITADLHCRHVSQVDGRAIALFEHDAFDVRDGIRRLHQPDAAHDEFHPVFFDDLAAHVDVAFLNGLHHFLQRHAGRAHFRGRHFDLILSDKPTNAAHFGDALHRIELIADEPVLQRA
jgi:hypothetical protein